MEHPHAAREPRVLEHHDVAVALELVEARSEEPAEPVDRRPLTDQARRLYVRKRRPIRDRVG